MGKTMETHGKKNNDQHGNTWKTHCFPLHKTFPRLQSVDFSRAPPHLGLGRLVGPDCGVLVGLGDFFGTPLRNPHDPIKNKDSTRKNGDIMGYNQQTWGARPAVTVSYGNPLIIGESSPHVST